MRFVGFWRSRVCAFGEFDYCVGQGRPLTGRGSEQEVDCGFTASHMLLRCRIGRLLLWVLPRAGVQIWTRLCRKGKVRA